MTRILRLFIILIVTPVVISSQSYAAPAELTNYYSSDDYIVYGGKTSFMSAQMYECRLVINSKSFQTVLSTMNFNELKGYAMLDVLFNKGVYASRFIADVGDGEPLHSDQYMGDMRAGFLFAPINELSQLTNFDKLYITAFDGDKSTTNAIDLTEFPAVLGAFEECVATMD